MPVPPSVLGTKPGATRRFGVPVPLAGQRRHPARPPVMPLVVLPQTPARPPVMPPPVMPPAVMPPAVMPPPVMPAPSAVPPPVFVPGRPLHPLATAGVPATPPTVPVAGVDRRIDAVPFPEANGWSEPTAPELVPWAVPPDDAPVELAAGTPYDLWQGLLTDYLAVRNLGVSAEGEAFPETTAGDVRRTAALLSRELCHPRYDLAGLAQTRAAWRDALARADRLCAQTGWSEPYPENERFWLSDSLALAQRLAAVDARRRAILQTEGGLVQGLGERTDPLTTWQDLWHFFRARRPVRTDGHGQRFPETTVGDVVEVARVLEQDLRQALRVASPVSVAAAALRGRLRPWRAVVRQVEEHATSLPADATYPDNAAFWRASRRLALWLSVARDLASPTPDLDAPEPTR